MIHVNIYKNLDPSTKIGIDPTLIATCTWFLNGSADLSVDRVFPLADAEELSKELSSQSSELVSLSQNLVDAIWEDRPARPASLVFHLDEKYAGIVILTYFVLFFCL